MKHQLQQKLRELITKHNPELLELTEGCYFWIYSGDHKQKMQCRMVSDTHFSLEKYKTTNHYIWEINKEQIESSGGAIIGHPIELRHLLIALALNGQNEEKWVCISGFTHKELFIELHISKKIIRVDLSIPLLDNEEKILKDLIDILS